MPTLTFLGTGTSTGVPQIGCKCEVCTSHNDKDKRYRTSAIITFENGKRLLIDCGPDFRAQMLSIPFAPIDLLLLTHEHYDHVGGIDDLRPFSYKHPIDIYTNAICCKSLRQRLPYCFVDNKYPGVPQLQLHTLTKEDVLHWNNIDIYPIEVMHDKLPIFGYRIGSLTYITDMSSIRVQELNKIIGTKTLIINALRREHHHSHQTLAEALHLIKHIQPSVAYLIHMSHSIGLHDDVESELPPTVHLAYDGLQIEFK